jgi:Ca-activated chloride channel homolog
MSRTSAPAWTRLVVAAPIVCAAALTAQQPAPAVRIVAPTENTYLSGPTRLVARFEPATSTRQVEQITFFANGKQVCRVVRAPFECDWDAGDRINENTIRVVAIMRGATSLVHTVRTKGVDYAESVDVDVIQVTAVVTDGDGRFVTGLKQDDFILLEDDKPQPITHFAAENIPLEMVAALDVSSSMEAALPLVKSSAKKFLSGLEDKDQVTLLAFNDNIFTLARRSTSQAERERVIDTMASWGGTALHDVIIMATDILGRQAGRRSIVLFSDGDDQSSHASLDAAIARTEGSDATIYVVGLGRAVQNRDLQKLMSHIAGVSGGRAFSTDDTAELDEIFHQILEDLKNQYLLAYPTPGSVRDGSWHTIKLKTKNGKYKVRAREGYRLLPK